MVGISADHHYLPAPEEIEGSEVDVQGDQYAVLIDDAEGVR